VRLLLDTHTFLWAVAAPRKLSARALTALRNGSNELYLSAASVWEMAIKRSLGKLETDIPLGDLIAQGREKIQLRLLDIAAAHAVAVEAPAISPQGSVRSAADRAGAVGGDDDRRR